MTKTKTKTKTLTPQQRRRLVDLVAWAAGEDAKRQLGVPNQWDQNTYVTREDCGTVCCLAGKLALEDGGIPVVYDTTRTSSSGRGVGYERSKALWQSPGDLPEGLARSEAYLFFPQSPDPDVRVEAGDYARDALGLSPEQARDLFAGWNYLDDIIRVAGEILAGA